MSDIIESNNKDSAASFLLQNGMIPITIVEYNKGIDPLDFLKEYFKIGYPTIQELTLFARQMHALLRAGVPIVRTINVVAESCKNVILKAALKDVVTNVETGVGLAGALGRHANIFPTLMISLINIGENSGSLDEVFKQSATHLDNEFETKKKIKAATRYPMTVLIVITIAVGVINVVVIPAFSSFFKQFGADLPLPTKILVATSNFTLNYWPLIILTIVGGVVSWIRFISTTKGQMIWDRWKLKIPLIGSIFERALLARFARAFSLSVRTGVPLIESIQLISKAADNLYVGAKILEMRTSIEHGESLTIAATNTKMFNQLVLQMFSIGEETGDIDRLLDEVALFYEQEVDYDVKKLGDSIEPILISVIACLVLILALGVFLPMWDIAKVVTGK